MSRSTLSVLKSLIPGSRRRKKTSPLMLILAAVLVIGGGLYTGAFDDVLGDRGGSESSESAAPADGQAPNQAFFQLSAAQASMAREQLNGLQVKPKYESGYERSKFGQPWTDKAQGVAFAGNSCKTREDILNRDLVNPQHKDNCVVTSGKLWNPYGTKGNPNNDWIDFTRGSGTAVDIDHVVALENVWATGGYLLSDEQRVAIANDPINLVAVRGTDNRAKGSKDVSEWVPQNRDIHCGYAASQVQVKSKYGLWVTENEKDVLSKMLDTCPAGV